MDQRSFGLGFYQALGTRHSTLDYPYSMKWMTSQIGAREHYV